MCNVVITATPPLAVSVTETEFVGTTQVRPLGLAGPLLTAAEIALALPEDFAAHCSSVCANSAHCRVAAVKLREFWTFSYVFISKLMALFADVYSWT